MMSGPAHATTTRTATSPTTEMTVNMGAAANLGECGNARFSCHDRQMLSGPDGGMRQRGRPESLSDPASEANCTVIPILETFGTPGWIADCEPADFTPFLQGTGMLGNTAVPKQGVPSGTHQSNGPGRTLTPNRPPAALGTTAQPAGPQRGVPRERQPNGPGRMLAASGIGQNRPSIGVPAQSPRPPRTSGDQGRTLTRPHADGQAPKGRRTGDLGRMPVGGHAPTGPRSSRDLGRTPVDAHAQPSRDLTRPHVPAQPSRGVERTPVGGHAPTGQTPAGVRAAKKPIAGLAPVHGQPPRTSVGQHPDTGQAVPIGRTRPVTTKNALIRIHYSGFRPRRHHKR